MQTQISSGILLNQAIPEKKNDLSVHLEIVAFYRVVGTMSTLAQLNDAALMSVTEEISYSRESKRCSKVQISTYTFPHTLL